MQGQGGGVLTWSVAVHWVPWLWGFPGGAGQSQPPPVLYPEPPSMSYKAICRGLLLVLGLVVFWQSQSVIDPKLAAACVRPGAT